jgi:acetate kinase
VKVLVINCGSSSIKADLIDTRATDAAVGFRVERVGESNTELAFVGFGEVGGRPIGSSSHDESLALALPELIERLGGVAVEAVGHRVVHGGDRFCDPTLIDDGVVAAIEALVPLAPLHNPANLAGIRAAREHLASVPHIAVFDTAFHAHLPSRARAYAIPRDLAERHGVRRYGFHGTSHAHVATEAAAHLGQPLEEMRVITCHLGNGASIAAIENGYSVETSMGMTPVEGLVMGTRSGDIDAGALLHIMREEPLSPEEADRMLNERSGLAGLSGMGNDMRDIEAGAAEGDEACRLALYVYCHRVRKYIGAYAAVLGGADAIVFTGGIGENSRLVRRRILDRFEFLGVLLDEDRNADAKVDASHKVAEISTDGSRVKALVIDTDEQLEIARQCESLLVEQARNRGGMAIPIAISARHVHLTQESVEQLFGEGHRLTPRNPLSQPGQFACEEILEVVGPKRSIEHVRVLGPVRPANQVEISRTDEFWIGIDAPLRCSGDVAGTPGVTLRGPAGELKIEAGLICAWRHIHMTPDDAERFGVQDRDLVEVAVHSEGRDLVFGDVLVRVSDKAKLEMHIDTDEGNAAELGRHAEGALVATPGHALIRGRRLGEARVNR